MFLQYPRMLNQNRHISVSLSDFLKRIQGIIGAAAGLAGQHAVLGIRVVRLGQFYAGVERPIKKINQ